MSLLLDSIELSAAILGIVAYFLFYLTLLEDVGASDSLWRLFWILFGTFSLTGIIGIAARKQRLREEVHNALNRR